MNIEKVRKDLKTFADEVETTGLKSFYHEIKP